MPSHPAMQFCQLDFTNPQPYSAMSTPQSSSTPMTLTPTCVVIQAHIVVKVLLSTPSLSSFGFGKKAWLSCKEVFPPTYNDYPHGASKDEIQRYFKCKITEIWRFQKLISGKGSEFRRNEQEHSLKYYYENKLSKTGSEGLDDIDQLPDDDDLDHKDVQEITEQAKV